MARTVYKGTTSYRDPNTGSIYVDRQGTSQKNNTPSAAQTKGMPGGNSTLGVMGSPDIYPGSLHGQTADTQRQVTYNGSDAPGPTWTGQQSTFYSKSRPERQSFQRSEYTPSYDVYERPEYVSSVEEYQRPEFAASDLTNDYLKKTQEAEGNKPDPFNSRYEGAIQSILDGILNQKSFNVETDPNYNLLYNQMREQYMNAGNKAMRDTMGAMQAQTGGYGSTAATAAGSQAYDNYLQGMNDQNAALMQLAYQMYGDQRADRYNQLNALTGLDNTDYARYRDTVNDLMADRDYYANMYQNMYNNDWNNYQFGTQMDYDKWKYLSDLDWNKYQFGTQMDYDQWKYLDDKDWQQYQFDTNMDWNQYALDTQMDWDEYQYDNNLEYQKSRDAQADYDTAFNQAYKLAAAGQAVPARYSSFLEPETQAQLNALAAQMQAGAAAGGSGGGSGRGRSGGGSGKSGNGERPKSYPTYASQYYDSITQLGANHDITNRNGEGWVYVPGVGRLTHEELEKAVGKTVKETRTRDGKYKYTKK